MHGKDEKCIQNFGLEVLKKRDEGLNRRIITKCPREIGCENLLWINLAQDKIQKHGLLKR